MARPRKVDMYVCREAFVATMPDGDRVAVKVGELARAGHPIIQGREEFWEPVEKHIRFDVEQATAAPGERRHVVANA